MDLRGQLPTSSFKYLLNTDGSSVYDGTGSVVKSLKITASYVASTGNGPTFISPITVYESGSNFYSNPAIFTEYTSSDMSGVLPAGTRTMLLQAKIMGGGNAANQQVLVTGSIDVRKNSLSPSYNLIMSSINEDIGAGVWNNAEFLMKGGQGMFPVDTDGTFQYQVMSMLYAKVSLIGYF